MKLQLDTPYPPHPPWGPLGGAERVGGYPLPPSGGTPAPAERGGGYPLLPTFGGGGFSTDIHSKFSPFI